METTASPSALVSVFQEDLRKLQISEVIRKHISTGLPYALTESEYFELRSTIANKFKLHPNFVAVVGSTRLGFSLEPKNRYREVLSNSDIDIAIVSQERFDDYWERVFQYSKTNLFWRNHQKFKANLFNGWIDPRFLPNAIVFEPAVSWVRFFDGLTNSRKYGLRTITARLYRSWERLEAYQERSVLACKSLLEAN